MRKKKKHIIIAVLLTSVLAATAAPQKKRFPSFIGIESCKKCHEAAAIGNQYGMWLSSPHAKAYQTLTTQKAVDIAEKAAAGAPVESMQCLKCHTTGGGKTDATRTEGVGCEACHGPGSIYHDFSNHASFESRENSYRKAVSLGMYPILKLEGIKAREKLCRYCHTAERACFPENPDERRRQNLPLSLIADFPYRHPVLRR